jgi:hypothetical protein
MLNLRKSEEDADVSFTVRGKTYLAHNNIIKANAPILASCCNRITGEHEVSTPKTIEDISEDAFELLLEHSYCGCNPSEEDAIEHIRLHTICRCSILSIAQRVCRIVLFVAFSSGAQKQALETAT